MNKPKIVLANKSDCSGCSACEDACPCGCIRMEYDGLHRYPKIDVATCIECGTCMHSCPVVTQKVRGISTEQKYYRAWARNSRTRTDSTSGGVGTAMAEYALKENYHIVGASFDDKWYLKHKITTSIEGIDKFRGSKYLQSDSSGIYRQILQLLKDGEKVFFTGTPCQVEALFCIVPQQYRENLITVGIICHGVNSPIVWSDYVGYMEHRHKSVLTDYNFRSKSQGWGVLRVAYTFASGRHYDQPAWKNLFHVWFGHHYIMRESCFHCKYRYESRNSDITIGDFWGIQKIIPSIKYKEGVSVLIASTQKGKDFINNCDCLDFYAVDKEKTIQVLKGFVDSGNESKRSADIAKMRKFETEYMLDGFRKMMKRYPVETVWSRVVKSVKYRIRRCREI